MAHVELDGKRAALGEANVGGRWIVGDVRSKAQELIETFQQKATGGLDLLAVTPPCQGLSSSNPGRGKRVAGAVREQEDRNTLLLAAVPIIKALKLRVVVAENVPQILTLRVGGSDGNRRHRLQDPVLCRPNGRLRGPSGPKALGRCGRPPLGAVGGGARRLPALAPSPRAGKGLNAPLTPGSPACRLRRHGGASV